HQVLMHPIHWMAPSKRYFFHSTARSGSKWLTSILDKATHLEARHEYALNHQWVDGEAIFRKHTGPGFRDLQFDRGRVAALLGDYREIIADRKLDQAEVNVYLEEFRDVLQREFPDCEEFQLVRDPASVVRSIHDRNWYQAAVDGNHKQPRAGDWQSLDAFARCCWYVRDVLENLDDLERRRMRLEDISKGPAALGEALKALGIPFYPRLLQESDFEASNRHKRWVLGEYADWRFRDRCVFQAILGSVRRRLGYPRLQNRLVSMVMAAIGKWLVRRSFRLPTEVGEAVTAFDQAVDLEVDATRHFAVGGKLEIDGDSRRFETSGERNALLIAGGSRWGKATSSSAWPVEHGMHLRAVLKAGVSSGREARLYLLYIDGERNVIERKLAGYVRSDAETIEVIDRPPSLAEFVDVALFIAMEEQPAELHIQSLKLAWISNRENRP
ncbi:MAG: hypothetical protein R3270_11575, partial [Gammaproteobacteria bacterium]|nr:hypothetical protein [Gammaproteobacteria bacterium]